MSDTELIVPVEVHALLANQTVRTTHPFYRVRPSFRAMLRDKTAAEPEAFSNGDRVDLDETFEGVHVQWQLPEALTEGFVDESTGQTRFPLVPNRWLVVRYSEVRGVSKAAGWIVHSDYLLSDHPEDEDDYEDGTLFINSYLNPRLEKPQVDWLGRIHLLADGPWRERGDHELFLTAVGAGLPTFAAYQPYHEKVFSIHDDLSDLKESESYPPPADLSYLVVGWYSDVSKDILRQAADIPGLLPPGSTGSPAEVIGALGWTLAGRTAATTLGTTEPHGIENILDHRSDTYYLSAGPAARSGRITLDLGSEQQVSAVRVRLGDPRGEHLLPAVRLQASLDGTTWPAPYDQDFAAGSPVLEYAPAAPLTARYLRIELLADSPEPIAVRSFQATAAPAVSRTLYSGTALGLTWQRDGQAPAPDKRPEQVDVLKIALGHSLGEAAPALVDRQTRSPRTARLFSALFHGTLDTFDGADGDRDLQEITHKSWFAGSDGGHTWRIVPRPGAEPPTSPASRSDLVPAWLEQLNADQAAHDAALPVLAERQWRLWALWWLYRTPVDQRPDDLDPGFEADCAYQVDPDREGSLAASTATQLELVAALRAELPNIPAGQDPQAAIDAWASGRGLAGHLQLQRTAQDGFYRPSDPVLLVEGSAGAARPLTRDEEDPLPCRLPSNLLRKVRIGDSWKPGPDDGAPLDPGIAGLPAPCAALLAEFSLLHRAAFTRVSGRTALQTIIENPGTHAEGPLAEYTEPWEQAWLPMFLMWKLNYFPTPYRTEAGYHWTFRAPEPGSGPDSYSYTWNGTGAPPADFTGGEHPDRLQRLFRSRSFLAPTTVFVARAQLARYLATYPGADTAALTALREELEQLDVLSQTLDGFNDWLLQLDGGAQLPTEAGIAGLTGDQNHVPDGAGGRNERRFQPVRAGQFAFTDLSIVDRFGRRIDLVVSGRQYDQYPVRTASVTPNRPLYTSPPPNNPERFVQLPPRLLQDTRLAFTPRLAGWLLVNYLDQTVGVYGPAGEALGELRVITTGGSTRAPAYTPLPHSPYTGLSDGRFKEDHPHLHGFLAALPKDTPAAFEALVKTVDKSLRAIVDPVPTDDRLPGVLIGRPVALIHTALDLQLQGPPLTDPSWPTVPDTLQAPYTDDTWAIRLGDPFDLDDGLIGYFRAEPDQDVDYRRLHAVDPVGSDPYLQRITDGTDLALPARPADHPRTRRLTLLAHPHLPVHATTDILPVHSLQLDADLVHQALAEIRASFRLNPLLAPVRSNRATTPDSPEDDALVVPPLSSRYGTWTWAQPQATDTGPLAWDELPLVPADHLAHPDDPAPTARAGYLQLRPAAAEPDPQP
ncbi:discoidin domain-containing protein [Kitasatospora sp. NPDC058162]|uniref:discoidin domain-containing protein n=1 Tax=Kitasatospora sp. NPDC058162 TaxID=3346362 RepID=UPI0036DB7CA9